ncbi:MAG: ATP-dependent Clp protease ATP-binding subunit [Clostridia bacterium]|nr:ATP-dependent Clp protease ATP-binding subunit [Clostridia bacterium]
MLCVKCKKRTAVVFVQRPGQNGEVQNEGYCLVCAKEMGIKPVDDLMKQMGISEDQLEELADEMTELTSQMEEEGFTPGGAAPMPFFKNLSLTAASGDEKKTDKKKKDKNGKEEAKDEKKTKFLSAYCQNLNDKALSGKLDRIIGRDKELTRVIQILSRRTKNNPCLIGEPGVGKTAIAEGLALKIVGGNVPAKLADKEVWLLDLTALLAGTQFRGQFESRIKGLIEEVKTLGNIILVIDEVHNLVGTGDAEGSMNAANMLKPALSRGEIQVIGATTLNEYRKHIEKDAALERRFQPVMVEEPSVEDAKEIIAGIKEYYEKFHGLKLPAPLVAKAVIWSERYINDRYLPDKAIDLIDEACSAAGLKKKEIDELFRIRKELTLLEEKLSSLENPPEDAKAELDYEQITKVKAELVKKQVREKELAEIVDTFEVTEEDLAGVIELWTGIPANKISGGELARLVSLEDNLKAKIIGQDYAISAVTKAVKRAKAALVPRMRPVSFIFTGPSGIGKTELAKCLASELFDLPDSLIRLDMSEFMEKHAVSRIIGSPPGYVGYDEAGQLTEKIRRRPYSVILFDEIEKAHPEVMNILLSILDEGRITDAHGKTVDFRHTVIIMTSNAGSEIKGQGIGFNKTSDDLAREKAERSLKQFLRPEFLNRVDEIIVFNPLSRENFKEITAVILNEQKKALSERAISLCWTDEVVTLLAERSYSEEYGARNTRRIVLKEIEDRLVDEVIQNGESFTKASFFVENGEIKLTTGV